LCLGDHRHEYRVEARVVGQLRVEGAGEDRAFADRHRVALPGREDLDPLPGPLHPRCPDEERAQGLLTGAGDLEVGLKALQLPAEGVAARRRVDKAEVLGVADDQAGARAEDRPPRLVVGAQCGLEARGGDQLADRGRLAAGDDQPVETLQMLGRTDLDRVRAEPAQGLRVRLEVTLQG
jgi:hypothetical protein